MEHRQWSPVVIGDDPGETEALPSAVAWHGDSSGGWNPVVTGLS